MIARSAVTSSGRLQQLLVLHQQIDHLIRSGGVVVGQSELGPQVVAPDQVGHRVLELGDDRSQRLGVGRGLQVLHDLASTPSSSAMRTALTDELQFGLW